MGRNKSQNLCSNYIAKSYFRNFNLKGFHSIRRDYLPEIHLPKYKIKAEDTLDCGVFHEKTYF
jgi:hypothetical protein